MIGTSEKTPLSRWLSFVGNALLVVGIVWMVLAVAPADWAQWNQMTQAETREHSPNGEVASSQSPTGSTKHRMPSPTDRELTKICFARSEGTDGRPVLAAWRSDWSGELGTVIRDGGLRLNWSCSILGFPSSGEIACATEPEGNEKYRLVLTHRLGGADLPFQRGQMLELQHIRKALSEREGVRVDISPGCKTRVAIDSDRFLAVR